MEGHESLMPAQRPSSLVTDFIELNWSSLAAKWLFACRVLIVTCVLFFLLIRAYRPSPNPHEVECVWDGVFEATEDINMFLRVHTGYRGALLIFSTLLIDIIMVTTALRFLLWPRTWRCLLYLLLFYSVRGIIMSFFIMGFPEGHIFEDPGFPSLTVTYAKSSDFFFSGHVGFALFGALDNRMNGNRFMTTLACLSVIVECITMLVTRGHFVIDVIAGLVFSHYVWEVTGWVAPYIDSKLVAQSERQCY